MASTSLTKGTRKTYSFEEREILVNLIYKHLNSSGADEECNSTLEMNGTGTKRKSVWSRLTEEYNVLVGPENSRTTLQLRRCWENMKANKKNRDDKRIIDKSTSGLMSMPTPTALGLPPNVVFQPKDSEPFAFEGMMVPTYQTNDIKKDDELIEDMDEKPEDDTDPMSFGELPCDSSLEPPMKKAKKKIVIPKKQPKQKTFKLGKIQKNNELFDYTIAEAQLKLEIAALLKEEVKLKLEEAEYKKEEARMRMICANYKLQKLREDAVEEDDS